MKYNKAMNSIIGTLLQLTTSLLFAAKSNSSLPLAVREQMVRFAERSIQLSAQALAEVPAGFVEIKNDGIWPNIKDLGQSLYLSVQGKYVPLGQGVRLIESYTSFGDMNNDGLDDAVVVVKRTSLNGTQEYALAAMLNQGGVLFNIDDLSLGSSATIGSHHVVNGKLMLGTPGTNAAETTSLYELFGDRLLPL